MWKWTLFGTGTIIIIATTFVFGFIIQKINMNIQESDEKINKISGSLDDSFSHIRDFQVEETKGLGLRSTLSILESMNMQNAPNYGILNKDLMMTKVNALIYLAAASGITADNELTGKWKSMSFPDLERQKVEYMPKFQKRFKKLNDEKSLFSKKKKKNINNLYMISFWGSTVQALGLVMLALSEILFRL